MSNTFKIAHIREQGQDMVIVPLDSNFGQKPSADQQAVIRSLEICARGAGLAGSVVVVWREGRQHKFIAPAQWQPFFKTLPWRSIVASLNKTLTCG